MLYILQNQVSNLYYSICLSTVIIHVSEHIDCGMGCLTYSKNDICSASISDHNVYAVCKVSLKCIVML